MSSKSLFALRDYVLLGCAAVLLFCFGMFWGLVLLATVSLLGLLVAGAAVLDQIRKLWRRPKR
jgi:hypothetical protein